MSTATITALPVGTWKSDPTHSSASFAVKHMVVATFRGRFEDFDATLTVNEDGTARLLGAVKADSIVVKEETLKGHLGAPDFFDTERFPAITFDSTSFRTDGDELIVSGDLTIKGETRAVEGRGDITPVHEDLHGNERVGVHLEASIDRSHFGVSWNAPLPKGGLALANDTKLLLDLFFVKS